MSMLTRFIKQFNPCECNSSKLSTGFLFLLQFSGSLALTFSSLTEFGWVTLQMQPDVLRRHNVMETFSLICFYHPSPGPPPAPSPGKYSQNAVVERPS